MATLQTDRLARLVARCEMVAHEVRDDPRFGATSDVIVDVSGSRVWSEHFSDPSVRDVFSVTKTVVATLIGIALERGELPGLDMRVETYLGHRVGHSATAADGVDGPAAPAGHVGGPATAADRVDGPATPAGHVGGPATPAGHVGGPATAADRVDGPATPAGHVGGPATPQTLRHLLTMTRGAQCDGPWNEDAIRSRTDSWVAHICSAPQVSAPGTTFNYDNGGVHLAAAVLDRAVGGDVVAYADRHLFTPLGIGDWTWLTDPEGIPCGYAHLELTADALVTFGRFWSGDGSWHGRQLVPASFLNDMRTVQTPGGEPENRPYGYLTWVEDRDTFFAAGWAGQLVLCRPRAEAVVVTTGDPKFDPGPPPTDAMPPEWRAPLELLRQHVLPMLDAD